MSYIIFKDKGIIFTANSPVIAKGRYNIGSTASPSLIDSLQGKSIRTNQGTYTTQTVRANTPLFTLLIWLFW